MTAGITVEMAGELTRDRAVLTRASTADRVAQLDSPAFAIVLLTGPRCSDHGRW
jgi:hypothetical protein